MLISVCCKIQFFFISCYSRNLQKPKWHKLFAGHQLSHWFCDWPRFPGAECGGAGETEGGVEGGAEEDWGGDLDSEAGVDSQGETRCRWGDHWQQNSACWYLIVVFSGVNCG